jgi:hypothetical protein
MSAGTGPGGLSAAMLRCGLVVVDMVVHSPVCCYVALREAEVLSAPLTL